MFYSEINTFSFIVGVLLSTYVIGKVAAVFKLNYKLSIAIMVLNVVGIGYLYQYVYFLKINKTPANNESHRIEEAFFDYSFHNDRSAEVKHKLLFEANEKHNEKNSLTYLFYEPDAIRSLEVTVNGNTAKPSDLNIPNTYELKTQGNKNILTFYFSLGKSQVDITIKYSVKNALLESEGQLVYYNTFFPKRTDFSFNTNVKGNISFRFPENSLLRAGADAQDFWVRGNDGKKNSWIIDFKNKLPYETFPYSTSSDWAKCYDPVRNNNSYIKKFPLITRLDFSSTPFGGSLHPFAEDLKRSPSVSELKKRNEENNGKYSDIKFIISIFGIGIGGHRGHYLFLIFDFPIIYSYYRKQKDKKEAEKISSIVD